MPEINVYFKKGETTNSDMLIVEVPRIADRAVREMIASINHNYGIDAEGNIYFMTNARKPITVSFGNNIEIKMDDSNILQPILQKIMDCEPNLHWTDEKNKTENYGWVIK